MFVQDGFGEHAAGPGPEAAYRRGALAGVSVERRLGDALVDEAVVLVEEEPRHGLRSRWPRRPRRCRVDPQHLQHDAVAPGACRGVGGEQQFAAPAHHAGDDQPVPVVVDADGGRPGFPAGPHLCPRRAGRHGRRRGRSVRSCPGRSNGGWGSQAGTRRSRWPSSSRRRLSPRWGRGGSRGRGGCAWTSLLGWRRSGAGQKSETSTGV